MRDLLIAAIVFGALPWVIFSRPHIGLYLYSWIGYMNPHRLAYGFAYSFPWAYILAVATLVGIFFSKEPKRMPWTREMTVLSLFILWMLVTTAFALYPDLAWVQMEKVLKIQIMIFLTPLLINTRERLRNLVWVIVLSLGFYGVKGGVFTMLTGGSYHVWGPEESFIGGNNEMALALLMTIPLIRYLQLTEPRKWLRLALGGAMLLCAVAAIGSQSRGALVGAATMGLFFWLKSRNKGFMAIFILVATILVASIMPSSWYSRMDSIDNYKEDASAQGRINAWWTAWNVATHRITGGGFDMFQVETFQAYAPNPNDLHDAHSIYFMALGHHGFVGLGLFLLLAVLAWRTGSWSIRRAKLDPEKRWAADLAAMCQVSMIGYASAGAFLGLTYFDLYYHILMIIVMSKVVLLQEEKLASTQAGKGAPNNASARVNRQRTLPTPGAG
jgi:putative inorganic carbon (HCO3(-)) transporter